MTKKVLVVDDDDTFQSLCVEVFHGKDVQVIGAISLKEAREAFALHPDVDLIFMDGCLPGEQLNTLPLVREFRKTYAGPMIASSGRKSYRELLMKEGCSHQGSKSEAWRLALELLGFDRPKW